MVKLENSLVINGELALVFSDGVECYIPLKRLRDACPCAMCQGEADALGRVYKPQTSVGKNGYDVQEVEMMGGYALRMHWGDRHASGIYSYDLLRALAGAED